MSTCAHVSIPYLVFKTCHFSNTHRNNSTPTHCQVFTWGKPNGKTWQATPREKGCRGRLYLLGPLLSLATREQQSAPAPPQTCRRRVRKTGQEECRADRRRTGRRQQTYTVHSHVSDSTDPFTALALPGSLRLTGAHLPSRSLPEAPHSESKEGYRHCGTAWNAVTARSRAQPTAHLLSLPLIKLF